MISENKKSYMICEQCAKTKKCNYYKEVKDIINKFESTPLNVHFPICSEYESAWLRIVKEIEFKNDIHNFMHKAEEIEKEMINKNETTIN